MYTALGARRLRPARRHFEFYLFILAMKRCPIAAKIAGSIRILPCCVLNDFSRRVMYVCPICEASLSHHTLYMGHFVAAYTMLEKRRLQIQIKKTRHRTDFEAD